jgi:hypothetical protein
VSTLTLRRGPDEYQLCRSVEDSADGSGMPAIVPLDDPTTALYFLREFITDSGKQHDLRLWLLAQNSSFDMYAIDDDGILDYAAKMIASGQLVVAGGGEGSGSAADGGEAGSGSATEGIMRKGGGKSVLVSSVGSTPLQDEMASQQTPAEEDAIPVDESPAETTWIEIELLDPDGKPVSDERFKITMPDGSIQYGRLDSNGKAKIERLQPGSCQVTFPDRDQEVWTVG